MNKAIKFLCFATVMLSISACINTTQHALIHESLSDKYWRKGDYASSEKELKKVLEDKAKLGEFEPYLTYGKLAHVLTRQGKINEAEPYSRKSIAIIESKFGKDSKESLDPTLTLAEILRKQKNYSEAEQVLLKNIKTAKEKEPRKEYTASSLSALGFVYKEQNKFNEAEKSYLQALELNKQSVGPDSFGYAVTLNNLGSLYAAKGEYPKSIDYLERAIKIYESTVGSGHPTTKGAKLNLQMQKMKIGKTS